VAAYFRGWNEATYVPGLALPRPDADTCIDFKKQRVRWEYARLQDPEEQRPERCALKKGSLFTRPAG